MQARIKKGDSSSVSSILKQNSYYPTLSRKNRLVRLINLLSYSFANRTNLVFYNAYGLDIKKTNKHPKNYFTDPSFTPLNKRINVISFDGTDRLLLLNPTVFKDFYRDLPIMSYIGTIYHGQIIIDHKVVETKKFIDGSNNIVLNSLNEEPFYSYKVSKNNKNELVTGDNLPFLDLLNSRDYVIYQRPKLNSLSFKIHPKGALLIDVVTIKEEDKITILSSYMLTSIEQNPAVISLKEGLFVSINEKGNFDDFGFTHPIYSKRFEKHPLTSFEFKSAKVPYFKRITETARQAHLRLPGLNLVKWSFILLEKDIALVRGTPDIDIEELQLDKGGLKPFFKNYYRKLKNGK